MSVSRDIATALLVKLTEAANKIPYFTGATTAGLLDFVDEDDMASDSATALPSQQSVKAYVDNNAWTLIESQAISSDSTIEFDLPAGFEVYEVQFIGVTTDTDDDDLEMRVSDDAGVTFEADAGDYRWGGVGASSDGNARNAGSSSATEIVLVHSGANLGLSNASGHSVCGSIRIYNAASATLHTIVKGETMYECGGASNFSMQWNPGGTTLGTAAANDAIQFLLAAGTLVSGTIELWGRK